MEEVEALRRRLRELEVIIEEKNMIIVEGLQEKFWLREERRRLVEERSRLRARVANMERDLGVGEIMGDHYHWSCNIL